jgi:hypothetical protein
MERMTHHEGHEDHEGREEIETLLCGSRKLSEDAPQERTENTEKERK